MQNGDLMKIVIIRPPKFLTPLLARIFKVKLQKH